MPPPVAVCKTNATADRIRFDFYILSFFLLSAAINIVKTGLIEYARAYIIINYYVYVAVIYESCRPIDGTIEWRNATGPRLIILADELMRQKSRIPSKFLAPRWFHMFATPLLRHTNRAGLSFLIYNLLQSFNGQRVNACRVVRSRMRGSIAAIVSFVFSSLLFRCIDYRCQRYGLPSIFFRVMSGEEVLPNRVFKTQTHLFLNLLHRTTRVRNTVLVVENESSIFCIFILNLWGFFTCSCRCSFVYRRYRAPCVFSNTLSSAFHLKTFTQF